MKNKHKYFRNQRRKNKLERDVEEHKTYYSNVYFLTKEPDPKYIRQEMYKGWPSWWSDERKWEYLTRPDRGREYYTYYDRPEVPYSIHYYEKDSRRSRRCVDLKKRTNKRLRQRWKQHGEIYQHNEYRKVQEYWWELD